MLTRVLFLPFLLFSSFSVKTAFSALFCKTLDNPRVLSLVWASREAQTLPCQNCLKEASREALEKRRN